MRNDLTTTRPQSATRFSDVTLSVAERWRSELNSSAFAMPQVRADEGDALRTASREMTAALTACGADHAEVALMQLRSSTITRNESVDEAEATIRVLSAHLGALPADILRKACADYVKAEGPRYFPKAPGEILAFANPRLLQRQRGAYRFAKMAEEADRLAARAAELENSGTNTLDETRALTPEQRLTALRMGWSTQDQIDTIEAETLAQ